MGKRATLGKKVLSGKLTVDEARTKLGRKVSQKWSDNIADAIIKDSRDAAIKLWVDNDDLTDALKKSRKDAKKYRDWCLTATEKAIIPPIAKSVAPMVAKSVPPRVEPTRANLIEAQVIAEIRALNDRRKSAHDPFERELLVMELDRIGGWL